MVRRFPLLTDRWKVSPTSYSLDGLLDVVVHSIDSTMELSATPGILLSGGVDSSILAILANSRSPVPCFTIGSSLEHPDVVAASRLASEKGWDLKVLVPGNTTIDRVNKELSTYPGDGGVYLALEFLSHFSSDVMAGDGIDEQMGGYWWHVHTSDRFKSMEDAFEWFWDNLEPAHLTPMFNSAVRVGVNVHWVYLDQVVVNYISGIPLADRVMGGVGKAIWKDLARMIGVPDWVIDRPKKGFVNALDSNV